jgi:hypothetical protein
MSYHESRRVAAAARIDPRSVRADIHSRLKLEMDAEIAEESKVRGFSDQYIVLDTYSKLPESAIDRGEFRWNFMVQGATDDDVIGVHDKLDSVIEIQMGAFGMQVLPEVPYVTADLPPMIPTGTEQLRLTHNNDAADAPSLVPLALPHGQYPTTLLTSAATTLSPWIHNPYTQIPFGGHFTIQVREAGLQAYSGRNSSRYHFDFIASAPWFDANPNMIRAHPQCGEKWDTYIFTDPLNDLHGITLVFRNPDNPIKFLPDCLYGIRFSIDVGGYVCFTVDPNHGLNMGDRIHIRSFKSTSSKLNAYMNRPEGHVIAGDPSAAPLAPGVPITGTTIWTDPAVGVLDLSGIIGSTYTADIYIAKRRMRIPVRIRRVISRRTNFLSV